MRVALLNKIGVRVVAKIYPCEVVALERVTGDDIPQRGSAGAVAEE